MQNLLSNSEEVNFYSHCSAEEDPVSRFSDLDGTHAIPKWGYWSLSHKSINDQGQVVWRQQMKWREHLELEMLSQWTMVQSETRSTDTYISQCFFGKNKNGYPNRRAVNVAYFTHCWVDLDIYKTDLGSVFASDDDFARHILSFCDAEGIPAPTSVISSGRGYYLKWGFKHPVPARAAGRFVATNKELVKNFWMFGADPVAVDVSRILRLCNTRHSKTGKRVQILWDDPAALYDFDEFANDVLPVSIETCRRHKAERMGKIASLSQERARRITKKSRRGAANWADYWWNVKRDLVAVSEHRWGGDIPDGQRDTFGFLGAVAIAQSMPAYVLPQEIETWGMEVGITDDARRKELVQDCSALIDRKKREERGELVEWNGRQKSPVYAPRKNTIIDLAEITPDEMRSLGLKSLIDRDEKNRRRRKTDLKRSEWLEQNTISRDKPWVDLGMSRATWYRLGKPKF